MDATVASSRKRPQSYSDSFLFLPDASVPLILTHSTSLNSFTTAPEPQEGQTLGLPYTTCERWNSRILSFAFHIFLISLFETLFFFLVISKSENTGIQEALENYIRSTLATCAEWPPNTTVIINDILSLLVNATAVQQQGQAASLVRSRYNEALAWVAWSYTVGLAALFVAIGVGGCACHLRIAWKRILVENSIMIALLGLYEFTFFKTILYNYQTLTEAELTETLLGQLQTSCGLLPMR